MLNNVGVVGGSVDADAVGHSRVVVKQAAAVVVGAVGAIVQQVRRHEDALAHHVGKRQQRAVRVPGDARARVQVPNVAEVARCADWPGEGASSRTHR